MVKSLTTTEVLKAFEASQNSEGGKPQITIDWKNPWEDAFRNKHYPIWIELDGKKEPCYIRFDDGVQRSNLTKPLQSFTRANKNKALQQLCVTQFDSLKVDKDGLTILQAPSEEGTSKLCKVIHLVEKFFKDELSWLKGGVVDRKVSSHTQWTFSKAQKDPEKKHLAGKKIPNPLLRVDFLQKVKLFEQNPDETCESFIGRDGEKVGYHNLEEAVEYGTKMRGIIWATHFCERPEGFSIPIKITGLKATCPMMAVPLEVDEDDI